MVDISIQGDTLSLEVEGLDKLWAFKSRLEIPLARIKRVYRDPQIASTWQWKGIRAPGTSLPGVIAAGTFYQDGKRVFWDVHNPENTIVIELDDDRYDMLIVEVADPDEAVRLITSAIRS
jgi:hypothetical protein